MRARAAAVLRRLARSMDGSKAAERRIVWLLGAPRTGSTWLGAMLGDHPRAHWLNEPLVGAHLGVAVDSVIVGPEDDDDDDRVPEDRSLWAVSRSRPSYFFSRQTSPVWRPLLGDLLRVRTLAPLGCSLPRGDVVVVKEPHGSEGAALLFAALPSSRLLFLVRDPRDCLDSSLAIHEHGWTGKVEGRGALTAAERWRVIDRGVTLWSNRVEAVRGVYERLGDDQRLLVRYEDLRARPVEELRRVVAWLGLEADPMWVRSIVDRHAFDRTPESERGPGHHRRAATPGLWRENLLPEEKERLAILLAGPLAHYGYDPSPA